MSGSAKPPPTIAPDLEAALRAAQVYDKFTGFPSYHQREYIQWIDEAKRPETRARRISDTVAKAIAFTHARR